MSILDEIVRQKQEEIRRLPGEDLASLRPTTRDFMRALQPKNALPRVIAEIKPRSPSAGSLLPEGVSIQELAGLFAESGAAALSILTDEKYFGGSFSNLKKAREGAGETPLFCKDFILHPKQIYHARAHGADSFLLIARILDTKSIQLLLNEGRQWGMEAMVEIADEEDLEKTLQTDAKIIGINNRDLRTFDVSIAQTFRLARQIPKEKVLVSLSGFNGPDVRLVRNVCDAVLVGSSLCKKAPDFLSQDSPLIRGARGVSKKGILDPFTQPRALLKCCGVRSLEDARMSRELGVDLLGLNFVSWSKRHIRPDVAEKIAAEKSPDQKLVGVFHHQSREEVENICKKYRLDFCQLSGDEESEEFVGFPLPIIKGVALQSPHAFATISSWVNEADLWLFDGKDPGTGQTFDWSLVPDVLYKPFFIAGGVNTKNAQEILEQTEADGLDTASGVENEKGDGWEREIVQSFIRGWSRLQTCS